MPITYHFTITGEAFGNLDLQGIYEAVEAADHTHQVDLHGSGILSGLDLAENSPTPNMSILCALGTGYTPEGKRCRVDTQQTVDCSVDRNAASTIPSSGNERYIMIVLMFDRSLSTAVADPVGFPDADQLISLTWSLSFKIEVVAGTEAAAGTAVKPTAASDEIILGDVLLASSTTQITNAMIDTARRTDIENAASAIAAHEAADPAHAADKISVADTSLKTNVGDVQTALEQLQTIHTDTGSANALVITPDPAITAYAAGQEFKVAMANTNTGAATININSKGAKSIKTPTGAALVGGELVAGAIISLVYDGTNFQAVGGLGSAIIWRSSPQALLTNAAPLTWTTVDVSSYVPSGTKMVGLELSNDGGIGGDVQVQLRQPSGAEYGAFWSLTSGTQKNGALVALNGARQFDVKITRDGGGTTTLGVKLIWSMS